MDLFAGSETRQFICFRLDKEMDGQPFQIPVEAESAPGTIPPRTEATPNLTLTSNPAEQTEVMDVEPIELHTPFLPSTIARLTRKMTDLGVDKIPQKFQTEDKQVRQRVKVSLSPLLQDRINQGFSLPRAPRANGDLLG